MAVPEALAPGTKWQGGRTIRPAPAPAGAGTAPYKTRGRGVRGEIGGSDRSLVRFARVGQEGRVKIHGISGGVGGLEDS